MREHALLSPHRARQRGEGAARSCRIMHRGYEYHVGDRCHPDHHRPGRQGLPVRGRRSLERRTAGLARQPSAAPATKLSRPSAWRSCQQFGHALAPGPPAAWRCLPTTHGSNFMADVFQRQTRFWGMAPSYAFVGEPETNGVIEHALPYAGRGGRPRRRLPDHRRGPRRHPHLCDLLER